MTMYYDSSLYNFSSTDMACHAPRDYRSHIVEYFHLKMVDLSDHPLNDYFETKNGGRLNMRKNTMNYKTRRRSKNIIDVLFTISIRKWINMFSIVNGETTLEVPLLVV